jgi:hypothetical protein
VVLIPLLYPTVIVLCPLAVMDSQSPSPASADPSSLTVAALYQPPSNSKIPIDGNQSNADAPKFSTIIGKVGPPVGPTLTRLPNRQKRMSLTSCQRRTTIQLTNPRRRMTVCQPKLRRPRLVRTRDGSAMFIQRVGSTSSKSMTMNQSTYIIMKSAAN